MENRQLIDEAGVRPPRTPMEAFQYFPEGTRIQLIENVLVMEPAPTYSHQDVLGKLYLKMASYVKDHHLGKVLTAPLDVYLDDENVFQPDIFFISKERMHLMKGNGFHGAPDLIVEVLSPSTVDYDRVGKLNVYARSGGKEYWMVYPDSKEAWGYFLESGSFQGYPTLRGAILPKLIGEVFKF